MKRYRFIKQLGNKTLFHVYKGSSKLSRRVGRIWDSYMQTEHAVEGLHNIVFLGVSLGNYFKQKHPFTRKVLQVSLVSCVWQKQILGKCKNVKKSYQIETVYFAFHLKKYGRTDCSQKCNYDIIIGDRDVSWMSCGHYGEDFDITVGHQNGPQNNVGGE